jgi:hypothetical protein
LTFPELINNYPRDFIVFKSKSDISQNSLIVLT